MLSRRKLLKRFSGLPLVGGVTAGSAISSNAYERKEEANKVVRDYFGELGVKPIINAAGAYTSMTASMMPEGVLDAYKATAGEYVSLDGLHDAVGQKIADLVGCEAAMVTAGAASAMTLATAGVLTGLDEDKAKRIPIDLRGMKNEVIVQKSHIVGYTHAIINCGVKLVVVESERELIKAINRKTAMLYFTDAHNLDGAVQHERFVEIGKEYGIPTFNDAAAGIPPRENLWKFTKIGYDLVAISGGKAIRGPQSAGLLLGNKDLVAAARFNGPPASDRIGRGMKVNKEEMVAMWIAVERFLEIDYKKEYEGWKMQVDWLKEQFASIDGLKTESIIPQTPNTVPTLVLTFKKGAFSKSGFDVQKALLDGDPSVAIARPREDGFNVTTWMLQPERLGTLAVRVREELLKAQA
ncbi:MAG: aminotransferase class V-fold PLP-dependent enzyme [Verrucomicrobiota bacterium]|nr:aminotransferase class V-fold PLP-dependent enzyme [Verrucomicrobiota bacterium]